MGKGGKVDQKGRKGSRKSGPRAPTFSGYNLFTEEFFSDKEEKNKKKQKQTGSDEGKWKGKGKDESGHAVQTFKDINIQVREAWNKMSEKEKGEYRQRAEKLRAPALGKTYVVPFLTRCAPNKFMTVCTNLKERPDVMKRLKRIGFDKLVDICCRQINRDLCAEFMRCFDPPTKQVSIRGETRGIGPEDVKELMGLPNVGNKIEVNLDEKDSIFKDLRSVYKNVKYQTIGQMLMGKCDENLEFLFVMFALGTLLWPSASIYVSDRVLKVMRLTKDAAGDFDWCSFIFGEVCHEMGEYNRELLKGDGEGRKTIGGCIYFVMVSGTYMLHFLKPQLSMLGTYV